MKSQDQIDYELDQQIRGQARDKAFNDFMSGRCYKNPYLEGSFQYVEYKDRWEGLDYEESQQLAHQLDKRGI